MRLMKQGAKRLFVGIALILWLCLAQEPCYPLHQSTSSQNTISKGDDTKKSKSSYQNQENRYLYIITCDNGSKKSYVGGQYNPKDSTAIWNVSSTALWSDGVSMINVCTDISWDYGFLTKSMQYHKHVSHLFNSITTATADEIFVMLVDGDTIWSVSDVSEIWNRYDCARNDKPILVSAEMGCWMGYYCNQNDTDLWYPDIASIPTFSPFVNSGVVMGKGSLILDMLSYILDHNQTYYTFDKRLQTNRFHDQHAVGDYALRVAKHLVQLDYYQQFSGSFCVHIPHTKHNPAYKSVCKTLNGSIDYHCKDLTAQVRNKEPKYFRVNYTTCQIYRSLRNGMNGYTALENLFPKPVIWHGNGPGKKTYYALGEEVLDCYKHAANRDGKLSNNSILPYIDIDLDRGKCPCVADSKAHRAPPSAMIDEKAICFLRSSISERFLQINKFHLQSLQYQSIESLSNTTSCYVMIDLLPSQSPQSICSHKYICPESCLPVPYTAIPVNWITDLSAVKNDMKHLAMTCSLSFEDIRNKSLDGIVLEISRRRVQECFEQEYWPESSSRINSMNTSLVALDAPDIPRRRVFGLVVWISSTTRLDMARAQIEMLQSQWNVSQQDYIAGWLASEEQYPCRHGSGKCKQVKSEFSHLLKENELNSESFGWDCAQRRPLRALAHVLLLYQAEFVYLMDDDTFLNLKFLHRDAPLVYYIRNEMVRKPRAIVYTEKSYAGKITKHGIFYGGRGYLLGKNVLDRLQSRKIFGPREKEDGIRDRNQMKYLSILREAYSSSMSSCPKVWSLDGTSRDCIRITQNFDNKGNTFTDYQSVGESAIRLIDLCVNLMAKEHTCYHSDHALTRCLAHGAYVDPVAIDCEGSAIGHRGEQGYVELGSCYYKYCSMEHSLTCHRFVYNRPDLTGKGRSFIEQDNRTSQSILQYSWCQHSA